jgi:hypothetical protein
MLDQDLYYVEWEGNIVTPKGLKSLELASNIRDWMAERFKESVHNYTIVYTANNVLQSIPV